METCHECGAPLNDYSECMNVNCATAQRQATVMASRSSAKATALATKDEPRAFTSSGRVD